MKLSYYALRLIISTIVNMPLEGLATLTYTEGLGSVSAHHTILAKNACIRVDVKPQITVECIVSTGVETT